MDTGCCDRSLYVCSVLELKEDTIEDMNEKKNICVCEIPTQGEGDRTFLLCCAEHFADPWFENIDLAVFCSRLCIPAMRGD